MTEKEFRALLALEGKKLVIFLHKDSSKKRWWTPAIENRELRWYPGGDHSYTTKSKAVRGMIARYYSKCR